MVISASAFRDITNGFERQTSGLWLHRGRFQVLGGPVDLPDGSIGTAELAPNATQQLIGSYVQTVNWSLPSSNVWAETPIQANCTFSGATPARVEFTFAFGCPVKGQRVFWMLFVDGATGTAYSLGVLDAPEASYSSMANGCYYLMAPPPGAHRISIGMYGPAGAQIASTIYSTLYVTEQKR